MLSALLVCLALGFSFRHWIFQLGVETYLNSKVPEKNWQFEYERVSLKKGQISFFNITLVTKVPLVECQIERVDLIVKHRGGIHFDFGMKIQAPFISLKQDSESSFSLLDYAKSPFSRLKVDIEEAEVQFIGESEPTKIYFSLVSDEKRRALGTFYLSNKLLARENSNIAMKLYEWPEELILELEFQEASLSWMSQLTRLAKDNKWAKWNVSKGALNGHLWLGVTKNGVVSQANATLRVTDVACAHEENGLQADIESLLIDTTYPSGKKGEIFWQNCALKMDIKGGKIGCRDDEANVDFAICDLSGHLNFHSFKDSEILLKGYLDHRDQMTPIVLSANPSGIDKDTLDVDLKLSESNFLAHLNLSIAREGDDLCVVRGRLKEMDAPELAMLQHAIGFFSPQVKGFQLNKGTVTSELSLRIVKGKVEKVLLDDILADDLEVYWINRDILATCSHLSGSANLDFQHLFSFDMPNWEVNVQNGQLVQGGVKPISIQGISMQLFMCRKVFEPSWIRATYGGIDILLDVVGYYSEADLNMHLSTTGDRLLHLICGGKEDFLRFSQHRIHTDIDFHRQLGYWEVLGKTYLNVIDDWEECARVGFFLSDQIFKESNWKEMIRESVSKGWFETESISCEFMKFVNAYTGADWLLEGMGSFNGTFNGESLDAKIQFSHANFFSPFLDIRLNPSNDPGNARTSDGIVWCNFEKMEWKVNIPLYEALIHDKAHDFYFNDTRGDLCFENGLIQLKKFVTESEGVVFGGSLEFSSPVFKLEIDSLVGNVRQLEKCLQHIPTWKSLHVPFDGQIRTKEGGVSIIYDPDKELVLQVHLELLHGMWEVFQALAVTELSFDFDFSSNEKRALLTSVVGKIPSAFHEGGYCLNGKEIELCLGEDSTLQFDVRLENRVMDLIRCVGVYHLDSKEFQFDRERSHLFSVHPNKIDLSLDSNFFPKVVDLLIDIPLQEAENYGKILADMKIIGEEPIELFNKIYDWEGDVHAKISLKENIWEIDLTSGKFHCDVKKEFESWRVNHLCLAGFEISGELKKSEIGFVISNLKGVGESSLFSFKEGFFVPEKRRITLPIQEALIDFKECFPKLGEGRVSLGGVLEIDFSKGFSNSFIEGKLKLEAEKDHLQAVSISELYLIYNLDRGLVIKDSIFELTYENAKCLVEVPFGSYSFIDKLWQVYQIKTSYGDPEIQCLLNKIGLQMDLPKNNSGKTEVVLDIEFSEDQFQTSCAFGPGNYVWKGKEIFLKEMRWFYDKNHLDIDTVLPFWGSEFTIHAKVYPDDMGLAIIEGFEKDVEERALYIECRLLDPEGLSIQKFQGNLFGLDFQFLPKNKMEEWVFLGDVKIDVGSLKRVVGPDVKQLIDELKFHKGYELKGELTLKKDDLAASSFEGYLKGRDFDFLGYMFKTLLANISIDQNGVSLKDLSISDEGVTVAIPELKIDVSGKGDLSMRIPEITIDELRPSLLKKKHVHQRLKPFCIKTMVFQDVTGNLADERSFTGRGHLKFHNTFKEGHNLLDIPIEIISRLGLDIGLLVPIQGELDYVLKNGKLVFTKLKNSFSESKRSYFYLWNKTESYIDFSGNMHIDIRMKQYVLFKITELFILSIQGPLEKPKCFLR